VLRWGEIIDICRTWYHVIAVGVVCWLSCTQAGSHYNTFFALGSLWTCAKAGPTGFGKDLVSVGFK
jgi:hypothetical protein